jgi:oxygen-independent coproporphyrinogen-3 oxidase
VHLYLHIPFCQRRCSYCDFSIAVRKTIPAREYVAAIQAEVARANSGIGDWGFGIGSAPQRPIPNPQSPIPEVPTIYLGGGTPSLLPPEAIGELITALHQAFPARISQTRFATLAQFEVTLESNP